MSLRAILLHLRIPFSFFLMPVYWFAMSQSNHIETSKAFWVFLIIHLLIYPASNAYNSFYDKDEAPIGGLENPPPVSKILYWVAWGMDILAIILGFFLVSPIFSITIFIYGLVSKAYSNDMVRLKKYPIFSLIVVGVFQGFWTYLTVYQAVNQYQIKDILDNHTIFAAFLSTLLLFAVYPMTQIYQHDEDRKRGDITLSMLLGIRGTFIFTGLVFGFAFLGFFLYLNQSRFIQFVLFNIPTILFFNYWFLKTLRDSKQANFKNTMLLNLLASVCLNGIYLYWMSH
jgi:4-hydroxybenzoate polyprenyltransferase